MIQLTIDLPQYCRRELAVIRRLVESIVFQHVTLKAADILLQ